ncbi:apolipoprotein N-acyltransferase [bacterium]|nr:MAG: apolipoprotein N-acyltransferase [bacterium]
MKESRQSPVTGHQLPLSKSILFSILSGILLSLPFCNGKLWLFAWFGFVPLFLAIQYKSRARAFILSYLTGIVFWSIAIYWLINVTLLGQILLILYLALYFGIFGITIPDCPAGRSSSSSIIRFIFIPCLWVTLEYLRSHMLTGFGWALLGYSQYLNLPVIQIADLFGAYGVSFLVMMMNVVVWKLIKGTSRAFFLSLFCLLSALSYGFLRLYPASALGRQAASIKISVVQGNIPQELKWAYGAETFILERYKKLTELASRDRPDLIIWPEASSPGFLGEGKDDWISQAIFSLAKETNIPLLFGSAVRQKEEYFNSALLIGAQGKVSARYDKLHLVPFGEYIPLKKLFPFLETIVPIGDFTAGKEYTLFELSAFSHPRLSSRQAPSAKFAVLICFEDTIPELSRGFVNKGADFLVNITNDAWFGRSWAAYQHLSASVFRAIENRVPLARSANTGVSCIIDTRGRITDTLYENNKDIFISGIKTGTIILDKGRSLYSAVGDIFALGCLALALAYGIIIKLR